jgi:hypothetical protein
MFHAVETMQREGVNVKQMYVANHVDV